MKHFSSPITTVDRYLVPSSTRRASHPSPPVDVLKTLHLRLLATPDQSHIPEAQWQSLTVDALLKSASEARSLFHKQTQRLRVAYNAACIAERVALGLRQGRERERRLDTLEALGDVLRGRLSAQVKYICLAVRCVVMIASCSPS